MNTVIAEFRKLAGLPSTLVAIGISTIGMPAVAALDMHSLRSHTSAIDAGFDVTPIGLIGVIVLAVVAFSSEYTGDASGRQILTSLTCVPRRGRLLAAKTLVVALVTGILASVTIPVTIMMSAALLGHPPLGTIAALRWQIVGSVVYSICTALIAFAVTVLTRHGLIPLIAFIANNSLVSVTLLITKVTSLGKYLPDVAGTQMFSTDYPAPHMLSPVSGGVVMGLWTVGLLGIAAFVFIRRDA